ncbi:MAG: hypothetical protein M3R61_18240 [Chloroflexota bacterium]|nr:hypothetical protein [Chloroflexota bacterium]
MRKIFFIGCLALTLVACGQAVPAAAPTNAAILPTATALPTQAPTAAPTSVPTAAPAATAAAVASPTPSQGDAAAIAPPQELVNTAQLQLALNLKTSPANLSLQSANAQQWPDGALGCPQDGQAYPQVVTPGFLLIFSDAAQSIQYPVHTGPSAEHMLLCANGQPVELSIKPGAAPAGPAARIGELARAALAQELAVAATDITVVAVEATEWRDSSLGCPKPGMNYLQVITPGYKITLAAQGQRYEYHSDTNTRVVRCGTP